MFVERRYKMSEKREEVSDEEIPFVAQVRSGGGRGSSGLITIPKHIKALLGIENGDYVKVVLRKFRKGSQVCSPSE